MQSGKWIYQLQANPPSFDRVKVLVIEVIADGHNNAHVAAAPRAHAASVHANRDVVEMKGEIAHGRHQSTKMGRMQAISEQCITLFELQAAKKMRADE